MAGMFHLKKRQKEYLQILLKDRKYYTSKQLASLVHVSVRTVKSDIIELNEILAPYKVTVISKAGAGYCIQVEKEEYLERMIGELNLADLKSYTQIPITQQERVIYIVRKLLVLDYYITIHDLVEELYVSRTTINQDMKNVRKLLSGYFLDIVNVPHKGMLLCGEEIDIRQCISDMFFHYHSEKPSTGRKLLFIKGFNEEEIGKMRTIIQEMANYYQVSLSELSVSGMAIHMLVAVKRCQFLKYVKVRDGGSIATVYREMANAMAEKMENAFSIGLPQEERLYLAMHIQSKSILLEFPQKQDEIRMLIERMLTSIKQVYGMDFRKNQMLIDHLMLHIPAMVERHRMKLLMRNPILLETIRNFPLAVDITNEAVKTLEGYYYLQLDPNEFGYLVLYFNMALKEYEKQDKKVIKLVCARGRSEALWLKYEISQMFGSWVEQIDVCTVEQIQSMEFSGNEIIITTDELFCIPEHIHQITLEYYTEDMFLKMHSALTKNAMNYFNIQEIISENWWQPNLDINDSSEYYEALFNHLCETQTMDFGEAKILFDRVEKYGQEVGNRVVLLRSTNHYVNPFIHFSVLKRPILWETQYVQMVIFINVSDGDYEFRKYIYQYLSNLIGSCEKIDEVVETRDYPTLTACLVS